MDSRSSINRFSHALYPQRLAAWAGLGLLQLLTMHYYLWNKYIFLPNQLPWSAIAAWVGHQLKCPDFASFLNYPDWKDFVRLVCRNWNIILIKIGPGERRRKKDNHAGKLLAKSGPDAQLLQQASVFLVPCGTDEFTCLQFTYSVSVWDLFSSYLLFNLTFLHYLAFERCYFFKYLNSLLVIWKTKARGTYDWQQVKWLWVQPISCLLVCPLSFRTGSRWIEEKEKKIYCKKKNESQIEYCATEV